jgi:2-oxoglutarate dehydrogenase E2 component (dihydrolipoamide succinyltransferase)
MAGVDIKVPSLGESVTEATVAKWFKQAGEAVNVDEPLVELETDKVTVEVNAPAAGTLSDIAVKPGDTVAVGTKLGTSKVPRRRRSSPRPRRSRRPRRSTAGCGRHGCRHRRHPRPAARRALAEANLTPTQVAGTARTGA